VIPIPLAPNLIDHHYLGGAKIAALRRIPCTSEFQPEEWLGATVSRADSPVTGLAQTKDGALLRDLIMGDPAGWIGPSHSTAATPGDTGLLVKLLDAGQRLPVHVHPSRAFARAHLDCPYGKTEAWYVLDCAPGSAFYLGWNTDVDSTEVDRRRDAQDSEWMLAHMNRIEAQRGMGILVPAGTVHAIDAGIFVAEVQEPTDFSLLLEWSITTSTRDESHLGIGFDRAMSLVTMTATTADLAMLTSHNDRVVDGPRPTSLLPSAADPYFRIWCAKPTSDDSTEIRRGFAIALVLSGSGSFSGAGTITFSAGDVFAVPESFGDWRIAGTGEVLVATPGDHWPQTLSSGGIR